MSGLHDDRGQMALMAAGAFLLFMVFGVIVLDVGSLLNHRRIDQNAADKAALAGVVDLTLDPSRQAADAAAALTHASQWAQRNDVPVPLTAAAAPGPIVLPVSGGGTVTLQVINTCYGASDPVWTGVQVTVSRPVNPLLIGALGVTNWATSATATACAGRSTQMIGFAPWAVAMYGPTGSCFTTDPTTGARVPIYGATCDLSVGGSGGGNVGQLSLSAGGVCTASSNSASAYKNNIITGVETICSIGDSVQSNSGVNAGPTQQGLQARLATENSCAYAGTYPLTDPAGNYLDRSAVSGANNDWDRAGLPAFASSPDSPTDGVDNFFEVWSPDPATFDPATPAQHLAANDCDPSTAGVQMSPRDVVVVIVNDITVDDGLACGGSNQHCYLVQGFARMYIEGCLVSNGNGNGNGNGSPSFSAKCEKSAGNGALTVRGRFVGGVSNPRFELGLSSFGDVSVFLKR